MGWIFRNDINADTWQYHRFALEEYHLLFEKPGEYFSNLFHSGYQHKYSGVFEMKDSYWNDIRTNLIIKIVSVLHIFSFGNYYVNVILFNFLVFFGHIALYKTFKTAFEAPAWTLILVTFLLPSLLIFSSIIHKDGLVFSALSVACYCVYKIIAEKKITFKKCLLLLGSLLLIFLMRSYVFIALLPAGFAWILSQNKNRIQVTGIYITVLVACLVLFFSASYFFPSLSLPGLVIEKQEEFLSLEKAHSYIGVASLKPNFWSFVTNLPKAFGHVLLRPFFTDYKLSKLLVLFAIEWYGYITILTGSFFFFKKEKANLAVILFCLSFSLIMLLLIGYTVPILWAIVRYRSIYLPFLLIPLFAKVDWKSAAEKLHFRI